MAEALDYANANEPTSMSVPALAALPELVMLARQVAASARAVEPSAAFRGSARARLVASMRQSAASAAQTRQPRLAPGRLRLAISDWFARVAAVVSVVALAGAATASASASALPGEPLYAIKEAAQQVALATATNDAARQQVLLWQAATRLEETSRLLEQGRDAEAGQSAMRYGDVLETTSSALEASEQVETSLQAGHARLGSLLAEAPPPARAGLQRAFDATERGLARARGVPQSDGDQPQRLLPAVVQQVPDARPEPKPAPATPVTPTLGAVATADQAPHTSEDRHPDDGASRQANPPQRPAKPAPAVNKSPAGAVTQQVQPGRHGRP
jgi:hypothetical protein